MSSYITCSPRPLAQIASIKTSEFSGTKTGKLAGKSVKIAETDDTPTISKTHRMSLVSFKGIGVMMRALFLFMPIMAVAIPLTFAMWTGQMIGKACKRELSLGVAEKTLKFAMTKLLGCDGKKIIGLENAYGQTYRSRDLIVPQNGNKGSITLGDIPTGMSRDSIIEELHKDDPYGVVNPLHVIDLTETKERITTTSGTPVTQKDWEELGVAYVNHEAKDLVPLELDLVSKVVEEMHEAVLTGKNVYIHCKAGVGRSATILAAYLTKYGSNDTQMSANEALQYIEERRFINLSKEQAAKVHEFKAMLNILDKITPVNQIAICNQLTAAIENKNMNALTDPVFTYLKHAITEGTKAGKEPDLSGLKTILAEINKIPSIDDSGVQID